jgi:PilZ domain
MAQEVRVPRAEIRLAVKIFVKLSNPDTGSFELAQTVDVSLHGARVLSKTFFPRNQQLLLRSIRSAFTSWARVAHCDPRQDGSFAVGLELYKPAPDWSSTANSIPARS